MYLQSTAIQDIQSQAHGLVVNCYSVVGWLALADTGSENDVVHGVHIGWESVVTFVVIIHCGHLVTVLG